MVASGRDGMCGEMLSYKTTPKSSGGERVRGAWASRPVVTRSAQVWTHFLRDGNGTELEMG
jgi:hypothetical protein